MKCNRNLLTLEQLRQTDRNPVYVEVLDKSKTFIRSSGWGQVEIETFGPDDEVANIWWPGSEVNDCGILKDYGKTWAVYAYRPIDFDDWEPCRYCRLGICATCINHTASIGEDPCAKCNGRSLYKPLAFCPYCGRPMTPDARMHLEKRIAESALNR